MGHFVVLFTLVQTGTIIHRYIAVMSLVCICTRLYSKVYGAEPRYNDLQNSDIPGLTMGMSLTERKIFPVFTISEYNRPQEMLI